MNSEIRIYRSKADTAPLRFRGDELAACVVDLHGRSLQDLDPAGVVLGPPGGRALTVGSGLPVFGVVRGTGVGEPMLAVATAGRNASLAVGHRADQARFAADSPVIAIR